jgi:ABC-type lipoprotein export system ATPase subunit
MLKRLALKNFTVFEKADLEFSPGINVVVGENGSGKSHLLKLLYAISDVSASYSLDSLRERPVSRSKTDMQPKLRSKLIGVFKPDSLGRLCRRGSVGLSTAEVNVKFYDDNASFGFQFSSTSKAYVQLTSDMPKSFLIAPSLFVPAKEIISIFPNFLSLYSHFPIQFDETYRDLCDWLDVPIPIGAKEREIKTITDEIKNYLGGNVYFDKITKKFALKTNELGKVEMHLVSEGLRKFALLYAITANQTLTLQSTLYWDEPDANLNPKLMKLLVRLLVTMASKYKVQIVLATHSLFFLRELQLLSWEMGKELPIRFFALETIEPDTEKGSPRTVVHSGDSLESVSPVVALDEEIEQFERYRKASFKNP